LQHFSSIFRHRKDFSILFGLASALTRSGWLSGCAALDVA